MSQLNPGVHDAAYWDETELNAEIQRIFDICHGCRMCFNLCGSFPALFDAIDEETPHESVEELTGEHVQRVVDLCFQCKLCYVKCPYIPPHDYRLDFPRLMMRAKALRAADQGVSFTDRVMSDPEMAGAMARPMAPIVNRANRNRLLRWMAEATMGIHRDRNLPEFHREPFRQWFERSRRARSEDASAEPAGKVALFHTCFVNYNEPSIGQAAVEVLARNNVEVVCPDQKCCGMPAIDCGDLDKAREHAYHNIAALKPYVDDGYTIVVPNPTCSYMLKIEYPELIEGDEAKALAAATRDLCEYVMALHGDGKLSTEFRSSPGAVAYHMPCHLRAQNIGYKSRDLMQLIPDTKVTLIEECSGHDGTWSMKKDYFEPSMRAGRKLFRKITAAEPAVVATDCPLAALQIEKGWGARPIHPIQVIHRAYEGVPFSEDQDEPGASAPG